MAKKTELTLQWLGVEMTVKGEYSPGRKAKLNGPPELCHPEEPAEFELEEVLVNGADIFPMLECTEVRLGISGRAPALEDLTRECLMKAEEP